MGTKILKDTLIVKNIFFTLTYPIKVVIGFNHYEVICVRLMNLKGERSRPL